MPFLPLYYAYCTRRGLEVIALGVEKLHERQRRPVASNLKIGDLDVGDAVTGMRGMDAR